jgi:hypothetical protein
MDDLKGVSLFIQIVSISSFYEAIQFDLLSPPPLGDSLEIFIRVFLCVYQIKIFLGEPFFCWKMIYRYNQSNIQFSCCYLVGFPILISIPFLGILEIVNEPFYAA